MTESNWEKAFQICDLVKGPPGETAEQAATKDSKYSREMSEYLAMPQYIRKKTRPPQRGVPGWRKKEAVGSTDHFFGKHYRARIKEKGKFPWWMAALAGGAVLVPRVIAALEAVGNTKAAAAVTEMVAGAGGVAGAAGAGARGSGKAPAGGLSLRGGPASLTRVQPKFERQIADAVQQVWRGKPLPARVPGVRGRLQRTVERSQTGTPRTVRRPRHVGKVAAGAPAAIGAWAALRSPITSEKIDPKNLTFEERRTAREKGKTPRKHSFRNPLEGAAGKIKDAYGRLIPPPARSAWGAAKKKLSGDKPLKVPGRARAPYFKREHSFSDDGPTGSYIIKVPYVQHGYKDGIKAAKGDPVFDKKTKRYTYKVAKPHVPAPGTPRLSSPDPRDKTIKHTVEWRFTPNPSGGKPTITTPFDTPKSPKK